MAEGQLVASRSNRYGKAELEIEVNGETVVVTVDSSTLKEIAAKAEDWAADTREWPVKDD